METFQKPGLPNRVGGGREGGCPHTCSQDASLSAVFTAVPQLGSPLGWFQGGGDSQGRQFPRAHTSHVEVQTIKNLGTSLLVVAGLRHHVATPGYYLSKQVVNS